MTGLDEKGKILEAFQLVFSRTGKTEATTPELIDALREVNPILRNRSNAFIRQMIEANSPSPDDMGDEPIQKKD
jgi:hypothetical protein